ncbi:MAG: DNA internalization-related competence protein ComEC/Rec2 [Lachnotalea sp.]
MSKRPLCIGALVYMVAIVTVLLIDTLGIAKMPLTFRESVAASLVNNKQQVSVSGTIYKQEEKNEQLLLYLNNTYLYLESGKIKANDIIIYEDISTTIPIGNTIKVTGISKKFQKPSNPGQFNSYLYYKSLDIDFAVQANTVEILNNNTSIIKNNLYQLKNKLASNYNLITKDDNENGTFKAMVLGDKSEFTGDIKDLYQKGGILHAFCVSGLHIGIIGMFIFNIIRKCGFGYKLSGLVGISFVICYGVMTGFGVSACRAVIMFMIATIAKMLGRTYDILSSLAMAAIFILMDNPLYIVNTGFQLSFGAIIGIGAVAPVLLQLTQSESIILKSLISSLSVTIVTFPIIIYSYYEFPIYSILLNLIIIPIMSYVLVSGILGCLCAQISVSLGSFMLGMGSYILKLYEMLCEITAKLPYSSMIIGKPSMIQIMMYYLLLILMLFLINKNNKKKFVFLSLLMIIVISFRFNHEFYITVLDVGQGDGIVIHLEDGTNYMIDGGSTDVKSVGKYRILAYLKSMGIKKLDYCILTHPDEDHKSGLVEIINSDYEISNFIMPETGMEDDAYTELEELAKAAGINIIYFSKGDILTEGKLELKCLHPYKEYVPESRNDYSTVLSLKFGELDMLLTGDVEEKGEKEITEEINVDYDILKVAHHGSKNSTSKEFLDKINAEYAIISCGENNRYGHPHQELLERLDDKKMETMITKDSGAITIKVKEKTFELSNYRSKE